jgi:hypothetical protein
MRDVKRERVQMIRELNEEMQVIYIYSLGEAQRLVLVSWLEK